MEIFLDGAVSVLSLAVVLAYVWSVRGHFASAKTPPGAWVISAAVTTSTIVLTWMVWAQPQPAVAQLACIGLELLSIWLFVAAISASRQARLRFAFDPTHPHGLVMTGPYRLVRHPFYLSYLIFWSGWSVAAWWPFAAVIPLVFLILYVAAARIEERNFAASPLATEYADYRRRVGLLWPRPARVTKT